MSSSALIFLVFISTFFCISVPVPVIALTLVLDTRLDTGLIHKQRSDLSQTTEGILVDSLYAIRDRRMDVALGRMETLVATHPEFRLAQLIYGDLLLSKSCLITNIGSYPNASPDKVTGLREEARQRFNHYLYSPSPTALPQYLIRLPEDPAQVIVIDISRSRLYLYENHDKGIRLRGDYYASVGKNGFPKRSQGDQKTPIGIYATTGSIPPDTLSDRYGAGAFPINYPNEWDNRLGRTGNGIWIHGVPKDTYSRAPHASDGCIAIANEDLLSIKDILATPNTPVILAKDVSWVEDKEIAARRNRFEKEFHRWQRDWESLDYQSYAKYYSRDFQSGTENRASWLHHKRYVNAKKQHIRIGVSNLSIFGYPDERNMLVVTFDQDYRSDNFNSYSKKRQYWRQEKTSTGEDGKEENNTWRIIYENTLPPIQ